MFQGEDYDLCIGIDFIDDALPHLSSSQKRRLGRLYPLHTINLSDKTVTGGAWGRRVLHRRPVRLDAPTHVDLEILASPWP